MIQLHPSNCQVSTTRMRLLSLIVGLLVATGVVASENGQPAPLFSAKSLQGGESIELEQYRGKVLLIDFWASWCGPCRQAMPALDAMRTEFGKDGFEVIAVNLDEKPGDGLDFLKKYPVTYPTVQDDQGRIAKLYGVRTMPMSYLIDRQGVVRHVHEGFNKKDIPRLKAAVKELLGE